MIIQYLEYVDSGGVAYFMAALKGAYVNFVIGSVDVGVGTGDMPIVFYGVLLVSLLCIFCEVCSLTFGLLSSFGRFSAHDFVVAGTS